MTDADSIWESKRRRLQDLDDQLDQEPEANQENRRIIAALTSRIPAIEASSETPAASETGEEQQGKVSPGPLRQGCSKVYRGRGGGGCSGQGKPRANLGP